ncbi:MAG: tail fiber domain-containing protein [Prolixibacteraceae bacterium]|nr:tail fiber domain-containing protein [Prolixibacteraceae bacterium]
MKKEVLIVNRISVCLFVFMFLVNSNLKAQQDITVCEDYVKLTSGTETLALHDEGHLIYQQHDNSSNLTGIIAKMKNDTQKGLTVLDGDWGTVFQVFGDGTVEVNGVAVYSDSTLKEGITTMDNQMDKLKKLKGVTYHLKRDKAKEGQKKKTHYGFLAQDVEKIYPDMVFTNDSGVKSIFYTELIPVLLEAVKAQQAEIESQNKQLVDIEKRLAKLELKKSK